MIEEGGGFFACVDGAVVTGDAVGVVEADAVFEHEGQSDGEREVTKDADLNLEVQKHLAAAPTELVYGETIPGVGLLTIGPWLSGDGATCVVVLEHRGQPDVKGVGLFIISDDDSVGRVGHVRDGGAEAGARVKQGKSDSKETAGEAGLRALLEMEVFDHHG